MHCWFRWWKIQTVWLKVTCLTWSELFDATLAGAGVDRQEVFEPGDLGVRDATGSAQHGGRPCPLHHFQLRAHVYTREAKWQQVLWKHQEKEKSMKCAAFKTWNINV